ncbi:MAG: DUF669 domain-containing protein [Clostridia bacterium]|nr:DUF669 domain-containing protein [Clostridia bacterium]
MNWNFEREETTFEAIPVGDYRCRIKEVEKAVSKNGNDMLIVKLEVSGQASMLFHYITFLNDHPEITNRMLTQVFDSFGIEEGNFNIVTWQGKAGGVHIKHDDEGRAKVSYFLSKKKQEDLPDWQQPNGVKAGIAMTPVDDNDDLPF